MNNKRSLFESAVNLFESLLIDHFWSKLSELLCSATARQIDIVYGPNKAIVDLSSEFYLGQYVNDPVLIRLLLPDSSGWSRHPIVLLGDCVVTSRFALSSIFGLWGNPAVSDPHRLLTNLLCEIESRVSLLRVYAMNRGDMNLVEEVNAFERDYFVYFQELMSFYNEKALLFPRTFWAKKSMQLSVSWWG